MNSKPYTLGILLMLAALIASGCRTTTSGSTTGLAKPGAVSEVTVDTPEAVSTTELPTEKTPTNTLEPVPTPPVTETPVEDPAPGWESYVNADYGFSFRYPTTWTLGEEPHLVKLNQGTLILSIAHGWASSPGFRFMGGRTGIPAGDLIPGSKVPFLEQTIPTQVLEYERKDKMVLYGGTSLVEAGDLVFNIWLEDVDGASYSELDIPQELQAEAKEILESFERVEATGNPAAQMPTPAPLVEKDLITYVNDDYGLAFIYPSDWELEEAPAGQEVPDGESATTLHLTKGPLRLAIQFKRVEEGTVLEPSGRPAGEVEERGTVLVFGRAIPKQVLVYEGKVKSVFLGYRCEDLELYVQLDGGVGFQTAYETIDISESEQAAMEAILSSLTRTGGLPASGLDTSTYENTSYGFTVQYPATWTVEEVTGETVNTDSQVSKLADAVVLSQDPFRIVVQYQRKSDPAQTAWGGSLTPGGMGYAEATLGDRVTLLGERPTSTSGRMTAARRLPRPTRPERTRISC